MDKQFRVERDILIYAMRYALGRMTFAPTTVMDNIRHNIDLFSLDSLRLLIRDIDEQPSFGGYGMECDERLWLDFREYLEDVISKREYKKIEK